MTATPDEALLADPAAWAAAAGRLMADLGFRLVNPTRPGGPGGSHLLVALREAPTLRHYDPEALTIWVTADGRGRREQLDRASLPEAPVSVSWGSIRIVDRLGVMNRYLSFGGRLRAAAIDGATAILDLASPGVLVPWGGHSQGTDPLAGEVGAFFARLMIPVDYEPGAEARLAAASPEARYAAFVRDLAGRLRRAASLRTSVGPLDGWARSEAHRLERDRATAWGEGGDLLTAFGLEAAGARGSG